MDRTNSFLYKMEELVKQVVAYNNVPCYRIDSIWENQTTNTGGKTSVPVVRVVGFFDDAISQIAHLLNNELELATINDSNASEDGFVTSAQVFEAGLRTNRLDLPEYRYLGPHKFELRISSILQDVYNSMHKDLGNGAATIPNTIKRDFYRIGALLEMADMEFVKIRNKVNNGGAASVSSPAFAPLSNIPSVNRTSNSAAPAVAGTVTTELPKVTPNDKGLNVIESMDMNVDSFNSLAVSIGSIDNKQGSADDTMLDLLTTPHHAPVATPAPVAPVAPPVAVAPTPEVVPTPAPVAETPATTEANTPQPAEGVALNIDKIETFNMNVSGMIERTTETVRETPTAVAADIKATTPTYHADKNEPIVDENTQMNEATLKEFVRTSPLIKDADLQIAERAGAKINDDIDIEGDVDRLRFLKVFTLKQLQDRLSDNKDEVIAFAEKWIGKDNGGSFDSGICLFYLEYLLVGKKNDPAFAVEYVLKFISDNDYSARYIIPTYNSVRQANGEVTNNFAHLTLK